MLAREIKSRYPCKTDNVHLASFGSRISSGVNACSLVHIVKITELKYWTLLRFVTSHSNVDITGSFTPPNVQIFGVLKRAFPKEIDPEMISVDNDCGTVILFLIVVYFDSAEATVNWVLELYARVLISNSCAAISFLIEIMTKRSIETRNH